MNALKIAFLLLLTSLGVQAQDYSSLGMISADEGPYYLFQGQSDGVDTLTISRTKKPQDGKVVSAEYSMESFLRVVPLKFIGDSKIYFVSIWGKGAHGEQVRILDPAKDAMEVARFKSSWAVSLKVEENKLIIVGKGDVIESPEGEVPPFQQYADDIHSWSP